MKLEDFKYDPDNNEYVYTQNGVEVLIRQLDSDLMENPFDFELLIPVLKDPLYGSVSMIDLDNVACKSDKTDLFDNVVNLVEKYYGKIVYGANLFFGKSPTDPAIIYREPAKMPTEMEWNSSFLGWLFITEDSIRNWYPSVGEINNEVIDRAKDDWENKIYPALLDFISGNIFVVTVNYSNETESDIIYGFHLETFLNNIDLKIGK